MYLKNTQFLKLGVILGVNIATCWFLMLFAERKGFEPSIQLPVYYLSRVAPSTTRTPLFLSAGKGRIYSSISEISPRRFFLKFSAKFPA